MEMADEIGKNLLLEKRHFISSAISTLRAKQSHGIDGTEISSTYYSMPH